MRRADNDVARTDVKLMFQPALANTYTILFLSNPSCGPNALTLDVIEAGALPVTVAVVFSHADALTLAAVLTPIVVLETTPEHETGFPPFSTQYSSASNCCTS